MDQKERDEILQKSKDFFKEKIILNHIRNTEKLKNLNEFKVNPFTLTYLSLFAFGNDSADSKAKALIYPRALGTSISTTFGSQMQNFCNEVLNTYASTTSGIDIEFIDVCDGRKKYCQIKAGPQTINKDDVETIINHFKGIKNLARTNRLALQTTDCVVGVFYGEQSELSSFYLKLNEEYPVYVGEEFWYHLTGDRGFYADLIKAFVDAGKEFNASNVLNRTILKLSQEIEQTLN